MVKAKTRSRLLALLLAVVMAATLLPLTALAADGGELTETGGGQAQEAPAQEDEQPPTEEPAEEPSAEPEPAPGAEEYAEAAAPLLAAALSDADYVAVVGDWAVPINKSVYVGGGGAAYPVSSWVEVTLTSTEESAQPLTRDFYTVSNNNSNYRPRGALFLSDTPAGTYRIAYGGADFATLEVIDASSSRIISLGGVQAYNGFLQIYSSNSYDAYGLSSLFESGYMNSTFYHSTDYYYKTGDGSVYLSLIAKDIKLSDITGVSVGGGPVGYDVIPLGVDVGIQRYMIKLADSGGINSTETFSVTANGDTYSASLSLYGYNSQYWLDISEVDQLKLGIVPIDAVGAQQNLTARIYDEYYNNASAKMLQESTLSLQNGRYTLDINH
ncbi:MAG: hypothetical protein LBK23_09200, partial [Oscillospiraceae bacterium]|nr:hypothetical protein [Oscillospiraceae bacterium]